MAGLPDIPVDSWNDYQSQLFQQASNARIAGLTSPQSPAIEAVRASVRPEYRRYVDLAVAAAERYNVDPLIYVKQIRQESGFNPSAGSNEGAKGIAQFTAPTAKGFGIDPWNVDQSLDAGARYMRQNLNATGGDYRLALASYNAGGGNVAKYGQNIFNPSYLKSQGWSDQDASQPAAYIASILGNELPPPPKAAIQPIAAAAPNAAWNTQQAASFKQAMQAGSSDTAAWPTLTVPTDPATQPSFRAHAQAKMDALGGADATQYPDGSTAPTTASAATSPAGSLADLATPRSTDSAGGASYLNPDFAGRATSGGIGDAGAADIQPPTDNANLKDFASYASQKIASLSASGGATGSPVPLGYNDMAGASSTGSAPGFGVNPQDATSPIDQARAAGGSGMGGPDFSTVTNALSAPARLERSNLVGPSDQSGGLAGAALTALPLLNPVLGGAVNEARNVVRGYQQSDPNQPILSRVNQGLDIAAQPFEQGLTKIGDQLNRYDPTGGAAGAASLVGHLATDPLVTSSPASPYLLGGTVAGALAGYGVSRAHGDTPEQTRANVENMGNLGMLAGGGVEGAAHVAGPAIGAVAERVAPTLGRLATEESGAIGRASGQAPAATGSFAQHSAQVLGQPLPAAAPAVKDPLAAIHEMYNGPAPQAPPRSPAQVAKAAGDTFVRLMTDRGAPLANFQQDVAKTLGRPLRVNEMAAELSRLNPDMAARVKIQEGLQPALQAVGKDNLPALSDYLTAQHNIDVAKTLGERTQTEALQAPLAPTTAERQAQALNGRIRMYQRLRQDGVTAGDGTVVTHYDELIAATQNDLATVNKRALRQVTAADAQRAAEAQAKGQAVTQNRQFSGGVNQNESQQALIQLQQVLGPQRYAQVEQAAQKVWTFADGIRQQAVDSGLWTPELANELRRDYPHYVPTKILDYMQEPGAIANGSSLSVRDQGLKRLTIEGTDKVREDPLASLVRAQYQMEALAGKNRAFNAFVNLNQRLAPDERLIREVPDSYTATVHDAKVSGFIDGKRVTYVMPKEYETVVKQEANPPLRGIGTAMQLYKSLLTSKNPAFIAGQVPLDAASYIIREATRGGGPQALPGVLSELFKAYGDAWKGFGTQTYHGNTAAFLKGGGGMGGFFRNESGSVRENVAELARSSPLTINNAADVRRIVKDVLTLKPVEAVGERFELAPRVASMKLAQQRGANPVQAIINGRTVTMDFSQGGSLAKQINQFIPFFNVGMQGLATPARTIRDNPRGALATFVGLLAAPTMAAEAWNRADPQREKDYEDIPNYIKDRSIVVMLPMPAPVDNQGERRPQYFEIRMREFAPFVDLTRSTMQAAIGKNTRSWQDLAGGAINAASPISTDSALGLFGSLTPPGISTGVDLANNRSSYTGATIATKNADTRASALSKGLASGINAASDATGLGLNVRPSQTEFAGRDLSGGAGQIARDVSNMAAGQPTSGLPQDTPLIGQVTRRFVGASVGQRLQTAQGQRVDNTTRPILRDAGLFDVTPVTDHITVGKQHIPLSNDEQAYYQELVNISLADYLPRVAAHPEYQKLSPTEKAAQLQYWMDKIRKASADATLKIVDPAAAGQRMQLEAQAAG